MTCCADAGPASANRNDKATAPSKIVGLVIAVLAGFLFATLTAIDREGSVSCLLAVLLTARRKLASSRRLGAPSPRRTCPGSGPWDLGTSQRLSSQSGNYQSLGAESGR